jgi:hypothetical protein
VDRVDARPTDGAGARSTDGAIDPTLACIPSPAAEPVSTPTVPANLAAVIVLRTDREGEGAGGLPTTSARGIVVKRLVWDRDHHR